MISQSGMASESCAYTAAGSAIIDGQTLPESMAVSERSSGSRFDVCRFFMNIRLQASQYIFRIFYFFLFRSLFPYLHPLYRARCLKPLLCMIVHRPFAACRHSSHSLFSRLAVRLRLNDDRQSGPAAISDPAAASPACHPDPVRGRTRCFSLSSVQTSSSRKSFSTS